MFYVLICCLIQVIVAKENDTSIIRSKRQSGGYQCPSGYQSLGISCQDVSTCTQATTSPVICLNGMCCLTSYTTDRFDIGNLYAGQWNQPFNPGTCPNGAQSIGISCQSVTTCLQATTSPVACQNGMCCLIPSTTDRFGIGSFDAGYWNPPFNPGTCPNGGQSIGRSCQSVTTCLQAITSSVACQNGMCCLISSVLNGNGIGNFNTGTCPNGGQSIGVSCQSVTNCLQAITSSVACQHGMCCLISSTTTDRFDIGNFNTEHWNQPFNPGTCPNGGQSIGISCPSVTTCLQTITSSVACQNGMCCLISSMSNGNGIGSFNTGTCPNGGQSIGISCQSVTTCLQAITSSVACQHGMCCLISGVLPSIGKGVTFNTGICPIDYQALGRSCQHVSTCQTYVGSASSNSMICLNGQCCLAKWSILLALT